MPRASIQDIKPSGNTTSSSLKANTSSLNPAALVKSASVRAFVDRFQATTGTTISGSGAFIGSPIGLLLALTYATGSSSSTETMRGRAPRATINTN